MKIVEMELEGVDDSSFESEVANKTNPAFFTIYLPDFNSHKLMIPPQFIIEQYKGNIPKEIKLRNKNGKTWRTKTQVKKQRVFITHGWKEYAKDHSLVRGDFMVFKQVKKSLFFVDVFGVDGTLKDEPL